MPNAFANRIKTLRAALRYDDKLHITDVGANPMNFEAPYKDLQENGDVVITGFDPQAETLVTLTEGRGEGDRYLPHAIGALDCANVGGAIIPPNSVFFA